MWKAKGQVQKAKGKVADAAAREELLSASDLCLLPFPQGRAV
jgi:hypothetical protein